VLDESRLDAVGFFQRLGALDQCPLGTFCIGDVVEGE